MVADLEARDHAESELERRHLLQVRAAAVAEVVLRRQAICSGHQREDVLELVLVPSGQLDEVVEQSDLLIIGAPHAAYADIEPVVPIVDVWNLLGQGVRV